MIQAGHWQTKSTYCCCGALQVYCGVDTSVPGAEYQVQYVVNSAGRLTVVTRSVVVGPAACPPGSTSCGQEQPQGVVCDSGERLAEEVGPLWMGETRCMASEQAANIVVELWKPNCLQFVSRKR